MQPLKQSTVLIAQISGSEQLLHALGQTAGARALSECMQRMRRTAESAGGRLVKATGTELTILFDAPDRAATAASRMHSAASSAVPNAPAELGVHVGLHSGPVTETASDVLGDTVKLAARLLRLAQRGQTITSQRTAALLSPAFQAYSRQMYTVPMEGRPSLYEISSQPSARAFAQRAVHRLELRYRGETIPCWRENETVVIGRDRGCGLVIDAPLASRRHCTVRYTGEGLVVVDHSRNGTYVTNEGAGEVELRGGELPLSIRGWLAFGKSRGPGDDVLEFEGQ